MSCITKGNIRCTKCCEAIHISQSQYRASLSGRVNLIDQHLIFGKEEVWQEISVRQAKKINPYIFKNNPEAKKDLQFFTCKALKKGVGCTIRDTGLHPNVCKIYEGGEEYSDSCLQDINTIVRGE